MLMLANVRLLTLTATPDFITAVSLSIITAANNSVCHTFFFFLGDRTGGLVTVSQFFGALTNMLPRALGSSVNLSALQMLSQNNNRSGLSLDMLTGFLSNNTNLDLLYNISKSLETNGTLWNVVDWIGMVTNITYT